MARRAAAWAEWTCKHAVAGEPCKCRLQSKRAGFGPLFFVRQAGEWSIPGAG